MCQMQGEVGLQWINDSRNGLERKESLSGKYKGVVEWFEDSGPGLGMAQLIEYLLSMHQAPGFDPQYCPKSGGYQSTQEGEAGGSEVQSHL